MPEQSIFPDTTEIRRDLEYMTARWGELDQSAVMELRAFKEDAKPQVAKYAPDWMDDAVGWAESMNDLGFNVYAVRNPIRADIAGSATDTDIIASFFLWADCDDTASAGNVHRFDGPKWSASVTTGTVPSIRVHTYWELEQPCTDMAEWRDMQAIIARHFASDKSVINPSRIMRVGGTVAYPDRKKQGRGYTKELTVLRNQYDDGRCPVTLDQMSRVFGALQPATQAQNSFNVDIGHQSLDRERMAIQAMSGMDWHNAVIRLVASYVGKGLTDDEIHSLTDPLTLPDYTSDDTRKEVQTAINGARAKGWTPDGGDMVSDGPTTKIITDLHIQSSAEFLSDLTPPVYIVDGVLSERRCHSLTGFAGHGKTTLGLHLAINVASGGVFGGNQCAQGGCLFLAGENPDNVKWQYATALAASGHDTDLPVHFLPDHFQLSANLEALKEKASKIKDLKLIIIDSLQAFFEGENDNGNVEMVAAAKRFRELTELPSKPSVIVIAHPAGKRPDKSNIVPRGGSGFGNEMDGNFTVWAEPDGTQIFHHSEKHRGAPFDQINFMMEEKEFDHLKDHNGTPLRLKISRQQLLVEQINAAHKSESRDRDAINAIEANPKITQRTLADIIGVSKSTADRIMQGLKDEKLIRRHAKQWKLTDGGKEFFSDE